MQKDDSLAAGLALAMLGSVLFSGKAIVVKLAYRYGVDAATLIALRMLFALPVFILVCLYASKGAPPLGNADRLRILATGLIGYYGASYLDFLGLQYISAGLERLILYLNPTIVLVLSAVVLRYRIQRHEALAFLLAYGGIAFALWHDLRIDGEDVLLGSALVLGSAICYAIYLIGSGQLVRRTGALRLTSLAMLAATTGVAMQWLFSDVRAIVAQPPEVYWLSLFNALVCTVLPVFATMFAVERIGAGRTSVAAMVGPISTIFLAWIFLDESLSVWQAIGTVLVLAGIRMLSKSRADA